MDSLMSDPAPLPPDGPDPDTPSVDAEWQKLMSSNLPQMRSSANRWRDGLGALVTLVTTGLVIAGPESMVEIPWTFRFIVVGSMVLGLLVVLVGLFFALRASAGKPRKLGRAEFGRDWKTVEALEANDAQTARGDLLRAQWLAGLGVLGIVLGTGVWLLSPEKPSDPIAYLLVTTATERLCGTLDSGDRGRIILSIEGEQTPAEFAYQDVVNLQLTPECLTGRLSR